jgi:hypothetical protein
MMEGAKVPHDQHRQRLPAGKTIPSAFLPESVWLCGLAGLLT